MRAIDGPCWIADHDRSLHTVCAYNLWLASPTAIHRCDVGCRSNHVIDDPRLIADHRCPRPLVSADCNLPMRCANLIIDDCWSAMSCTYFCYLPMPIAIFHLDLGRWSAKSNSCCGLDYFSWFFMVFGVFLPPDSAFLPFQGLQEHIWIHWHAFKQIWRLWGIFGSIFWAIFQQG